MKNARRVLSLLLAVLALATCVQAQTSEPARIASAVDSIVAAGLAGGRAAGASVAVVRAADTLVMKGYGYADLEFDVATPERAIYEIGSITKQFTAAALLQLVEQGKVNLDAPITDYLPTYPLQGHTLTVRRLMDHTSGIKGYTEMPEFGQLMVRKLPRDSLVAIFSAKPFDFAPGDAMVYNNSAYFLLGLIIEKTSGMKYEEYVQKNLFERAGMTDSRYCSESAVVKRRAHGYDARPDGLQRAAYLDHTWPYAAGSLCSTVGDLVAWNRALHGGHLLKPESYRELITPGTLNDGSRLRYAKGLSVDSLLGQRTIRHGGGINGFLSDLAYFPDHNLTIAVLVNTAGPVDPGSITRAIAETIFGKWTPAAVAFKGKAGDYVGEYRGVGRGREMIVRIASGVDALTIQVGDGQPAPLLYLGSETFARDGSRYTFVRANSGVIGLRADNVGGYTILTRK
jgi:CubicO group peptidase (beta-lactamase class C family)